MPMWTAEFRMMTGDERTELRRLLGSVSGPRKSGVGSWLGRLFGDAWDSHACLIDGLHRDLECGRVQVIHAAAEEAIRLSNPDGSLAGFFVNIGNGLVMFIESREWDAPPGASDFEAIFPCSRFSLVRAPHSGVDLDFRCEGRRFAATREIEAPSLDLLDPFLQDGDIMPGRLETLEGDVDRLIRNALTEPVTGSLPGHDLRRGQAALSFKR